MTEPFYITTAINMRKHAHAMMRYGHMKDAKRILRGAIEFVQLAKEFGR